jgi:hypothetical protein
MPNRAAADDAANALRMIATLETPSAFGAFARDWFRGQVSDHLDQSSTLFGRLRRKLRSGPKLNVWTRG